VTYFDITFLILDLLHITGAPNNGTRGSLRHLLNDEFLQTIVDEENTFYDLRQRNFPENFDEAMADCKYCTCPYCKVNKLKIFFFG